MSNGMRAALLVCVLQCAFALFATAVTGNVARAGEPAYLKDISHAINPVYDGYVDRVIVNGNRIDYHVHGSGMVVANGHVVSTNVKAMAGKNRKTVVFELGPDADFAKSRGVYSAYPQLVAVISNGSYLINLNCYRDFPGATGKRSGGIAGNVVVYNSRDRSFRNLTRLDARSGEHTKALRWFEKQRVVLLERSRAQAGANLPLSVRETGKVELRSFPEWKQLPIDRYPAIKAWYQLQKRITVDNDVRTTVKGWSINVGKGRGRLVFDAPPSKWALRVYPISDSAICISNESLGTYLADINATFRIHVSDAVAIDYDIEAGRLLLKSRQRDDNGQHRYWLLDLRKYLKHINRSLNFQPVRPKPHATAGRAYRGKVDAALLEKIRPLFPGVGEMRRGSRPFFAEVREIARLRLSDGNERLVVWVDVKVPAARVDHGRGEILIFKHANDRKPAVRRGVHSLPVDSSQQVRVIHDRWLKFGPDTPLISIADEASIKHFGKFGLGMLPIGLARSAVDAAMQRYLARGQDAFLEVAPVRKRQGTSVSLPQRISQFVIYQPLVEDVRYSRFKYSDDWEASILVRLTEAGRQMKTTILEIGARASSPGVTSKQVTLFVWGTRLKEPTDRPALIHRPDKRGARN